MTTADSRFNDPAYDEEVFREDLQDVHLSYDYDAQDEQGNPEKWRYELWFFSRVSPSPLSMVADVMTERRPMQDRVVYKIHGGPMAGRSNFQTCRFQCIRPHELWQCNWLEGKLSRPFTPFPKRGGYRALKCYLARGRNRNHRLAGV